MIHAFFMRLKQKQQKLELIAPAGNLEKMKTAFAFGADAVYLGIADFSLRTRINDFTITKIKLALAYARKINRKVYVTVNVFAHNKQIAKLPAHIRKLREIGVDGLFISDPGVLQIIKKHWPKAKIILSTQANCTNWQAAKFWQKQGVSRVILARELTIKEIAAIHKKVPGLELECFVHGAMCMAYSGRCFLSKFFTDRNANLGDCVQPCRWPYLAPSPSPILGEGDNGFYIKAKDYHTPLELVEEQHGSYILNAQDLCLIKKLDELAKAGVSAFKIEGRAKSVYYLATVVGAYRKAIDLMAGKTEHAKRNRELGYLYKELTEKLYHRGYSEGFMFGQGPLAQNLAESHEQCGWEFCGQVIKSKKLKVKSKKYVNYIKVHNSLKVGDRVEIVEPFYDIIKMKIKRMMDSETGEEVKQAHGGQGRLVLIDSSREISQYSVIRRQAGG